MRLTSLFALAALIATFDVSAQTIVTTTKPLIAAWRPTDFASFEVRLTGRKATDAATANKIIGRIALKSLDFSMLTQRVTILVPANEVWEIKGLTMHFVPANTTGIKPFDIPLIDFAASFFPPPGQVLAIDVDAKSGNVMMGPVTIAVVPPVVVLPPPPPLATADSNLGDCSPPLTQLTLLGGVWTVSGGIVSKDKVPLTANAYPDLSTICVTGSPPNIRAISPNKGYECWAGTAWAGSGC